MASLAALIAEPAFGSAGLTYQGRLLKSNGEAVSSSSVQFKIQIRTPGAENCLLYEEEQVKDLSRSAGVFALSINDGSATVVNTEPFTLDRAFQNRGTFSFGTGKCSGSSVYTPNITDGRKIVIAFNDGTFAGWEQVPPQNINFVPMAIDSITVGGFGAGHLLRVVDGSGNPVSVGPLTQTQHGVLLDLLAGTSSDYLRPGDNTSGTAAGFTGALAGDVTGTQAATVVSKIQGRAIDTAAPTSGQALVWSAGNSRWEPGTIASDWTTLSGKPSSFPSDWTTTANKPTSFPSDWSTTANKPTSFASDWSTLANKPSSFAPSAHTHSITDITSGVGNYFTYRPNNGACAVGEVLKWSAANGGSWLCGTDISSTGGSGVASVSATAPLTVDNTDPNNPRVEVNNATTTTTGVVQLATSSDTAANLVVQANDPRLTNSRAPSGAAGGELTGNYPNPTVVASTTTTNNSLVRRDGSGNISGAAGNFGSLVLNNGGGSTISVQTPAAFTSYVLKLPTGTGTNGQILTSNGADMVWSTPSYMAAVAPGANGNVLVSNGTSWTSAVVPADGTKVSKAGDTMSGSLTLSAGSVIAPANGLAIGTNQLVASGGNVGIGASNPASKLVVSANATAIPAPLGSNNLTVAGADGAANRVTLDSFGNASNLTFRRANGTAASPTALQNGDVLGAVSWFGYGATGYPSVARAQILAGGAENWTDSSQGTNLVFATTAMGSTSLNERMRVDHNGNVGIGAVSPSGQLTVVGAGQATSALDTTSGLGGSLLLGDSGAAVGNGGTLIFSAGSQAWRFAAIKGVVTNGTGNSIGDIALSARKAPADTTLTEAMRIRSDGNVGIGTTAPRAKLEVNGGILPGAATVGASCSSVPEGTFAYDSASHVPVFCSNAGTWASMGGGPAPGTAGSACTTTNLPNNTGVTLFRPTQFGGGRYCCGPGTQAINLCVGNHYCFYCEAY